MKTLNNTPEKTLKKKDMPLSEKTNTTLALDPELYPLDVIYTTAYIFLDRAYIFLKKDENKKIVVDIKLKTCNKDDNKNKQCMTLEDIEDEFKNQLINYCNHFKMQEKNLSVKQKILEEIFSSPPENQDHVDNIFNSEIDDPEGILIPWEEKYGKKNAKDN